MEEPILKPAFRLCLKYQPLLGNAWTAYLTRVLKSLFRKYYNKAGTRTFYVFLRAGYFLLLQF